VTANAAAVVFLGDGLYVRNELLVLGLPFHVLNIERQTLQDVPRRLVVPFLVDALQRPLLERPENDLRVFQGVVEGTVG